LKVQLADLEQVNADLKFEVEKLRYDREEFEEKYEKERQTLEILRKLYNNAFVKES
jgi:hypothetical protein